MVTRQTTCIVILAALCALAAPARAGNAAVIVTGTADAKHQTVATAAVTGVLRQSSWVVVDAGFGAKDAQKIQDCFPIEHPWTCLEPFASPKAIVRFFLVEVDLDKSTGGLHLHGLFADKDGNDSGIEDAFCAAPCSETALAQSASDLVNRLLRQMAARTGTTFIEVTTEPPGAAVSIDGVQLGPSGQKFPAHAGRHRVLVQLSGYRDADEQVEVSDGESKRVALKLEKLGGEGGGKPAHHGPPRVVQWSLIGGGVALAIAGSLYSYSTALDSAPPADQPRDSKWLYNGKGLAVAGIGGAVAVGGLVWLLLTPRSDSEPTVSFSHDGVQAGWAFTF